MKTKKILVTILTICMILLISACSNAVSDDTVKKEVKEELADTLSDGETIKEVEIVSRKEKDDKEDINIKVTSELGVAKYVKYYVANYECNSDDKWILEGIEKDKVDEWTITPISGMEENNIIRSLDGEGVKIKSDVWEIDSDKIKDFVVVSRDTNLEEKKEVIIVELTIENVLQEAKGKLSLNYVFDKKWELESVTKETAFDITMKEGGLDLTEDRLIGDLAKNEIVLYDGMYADDRKTMTIKKEEVSNLEFDRFPFDAGATERVDCKFTLTKSMAVFDIEASIEYKYDTGSRVWFTQPAEITWTLKSVNLQGEWVGTYKGIGSDHGTVKLSINESSEDGQQISGVYGYTPDEIDTSYNQPGSYEVSGAIVETMVQVNLEAGEWIVEEPQAFVMTTKQDIRLWLNFEEGTLEGTGQDGNRIELHR